MFDLACAFLGSPGENDESFYLSGPNGASVARMGATMMANANVSPIAVNLAVQCTSERKSLNTQSPALQREGDSGSLATAVED